MRNDSAQKISDLIAEIYSGGSDGKFSSQALQTIAARFSSTRAALVRISKSNERTRIFTCAGIDDSRLRAMVAGARSSGLQFPDASDFSAGRAFSLDDIPGEEVESLDVCDRFPYSDEGRYTLIGMVASDPSHQSLVWFSRESEAGGYSQCEKDELELLLPHFRQATQISDDLTDLRMQLNTAAQTFDRTPLGLFFLNPEGAKLYANKTAQEFLSTNDGFVVRDGRLTLRVEQQRKQFESFFQDFRDRQDFQLLERHRMSVRRASGKSPYLMLFIPMRIQPVSGRLHAGTVILLQVHDPAAIDERVVEDLGLFYDLTAAEAEVCERLCRNKRLSGVADELGVSLNTAKTHLIRSFRKIGVSSQAELLQRLALHPKRDS
jgi:DNA-binding CsgD family transcriptional regulator